MLNAVTSAMNSWWSGGVDSQRNAPSGGEPRERRRVNWDIDDDPHGPLFRESLGRYAPDLDSMEHGYGDSDYSGKLILMRVRVIGKLQRMGLAGVTMSQDLTMCLALSVVKVRCQGPQE